MAGRAILCLHRVTARLPKKIPSFQARKSLSLSFGGWVGMKGSPHMKSLLRPSDSEWREKLTPQQFTVCRQKGTEPPWSGEYNNFKGKGIFQCVCCSADLFSSSTKFDSGSGWPSFFSSVKDKSDISAVCENVDNSYGMKRTEVVCRKCDSHLGHVFTDGPPPTGLRYCINSVALQFKPEES